ncbi:MAG: cyclic-di-AMP receptor [Ruminococcus sp.]|nr:cyclic-di-AMP receptor [Ruminococcus sp.]
MKLITAVIGKKDLNPVCDALREAGYSFTKIPTSGGFLVTDVERFEKM